MAGPNALEKVPLVLSCLEELATAIRCMKPRKFAGLDAIFLQFKLHAVSALKSWFSDFLTSSICHLKIPRI